MVNSVLTNYNSLVALQNLQNTQMQLSDVQNQISTGLKINTAKDDAATWAVATTMNSSIANLKQVSSNLSESDSVVGLGVTTANSLTKLLSQIKANVTSAQESANDPGQIQDAINQQLAQLDTTISSASFQGVNLLNTAGTSNFLGSVNEASDGTATPSYISVQTHDLSRSTGELSVLNGLSVEDRGDQLFTDSTATSTAVSAQNAAMSTTAATFSVGDNGSTATPASTSTLALGSNALTLGYTDSTGATHTLNISEDVTSGKVSDLASALNGDSNFNTMFHADTSSADGSLIISAANRSEQTGSFAVNTLKVNAATTQSSTAASSTMTFQDGQALNAGDQFTFNYSVNPAASTAATTGKVILQVGSGATGTVTAYDKATNTTVVNVNVDSVSGAGIKGADIADQLNKALTGFSYTNTNADGTTSAATHPFAATAIAGTSLGVSHTAGSNTISIASAPQGSDPAVDSFSIQTPQTNYASLLDKINSATTSVENAASALGSAQSRIETQETFVTTLTNSLTDGVSGLVDADMSAESARLSALQVQQQLGTQALSIANSTPQSILSLFK